MDTIASAIELHKGLQGSETSRLDCELLLCAVLQKDRTYLYTWPEKVLTAQQMEAYRERLLRRKRGEPIAHILEQKEFWSLPLLVNSSTLIPRPETELLVEIALELASDSVNQSVKVADLGAGTGAVGLALAKERPAWNLVGLEKQPEALALAKKNREQLGIKNINFSLSDWFEAISDQTFNLIVSNPPYIDSNDHHLKQGDLRFEPVSALVANDNGYADLAFIIKAAPAYLVNQAWLLLEHGNQQGEKVRALFREAGYSHIETKRDLAGQPRVTIGQRLV